MSDFTTRVTRALSQRIYLMNKHQLDGVFVLEIMGNSKSSYRVTIGDEIHCSCPDHNVRGKLCKHLLFVLIRLFKFPIEYIANYQSTFITYPETLAKAKACFEAPHLQMQSEKKIEGDCPICLEELDTGEALLSCSQCKNHVHQLCFLKWINGKEPTCVLCRVTWFSK